jgi:hypothetical protein
MTDIPINKISTISVDFNLIPDTTDSYMIQSPIMFSDGDHPVMYLEKVGGINTHRFRISDHGAMGVRCGDEVLAQKRFLVFNGLYIDTVYSSLCINVDIDNAEDVINKIIRFTATLIAIDDYLILKEHARK